MKKFQFRLEQVLQQKITIEERALMEQAKAQQECLQCEQELHITQDKLEQTINYTPDIVRPGEQLQSLLYLEHLKQTLNRQTKFLQRAQEILQLRRETVLNARRERMVLEKLKENKLQEYKECQLYLEQKEIDELATIGFNRINY
ncbi:MAG: flagellar export protein FliJ [Bacillota bacterium]